MPPKFSWIVSSIGYDLMLALTQKLSLTLTHIPIPNCEFEYTKPSDYKDDVQLATITCTFRAQVM